MAAGEQSWGTVITFSSGFFAQITSVSWSGIERASIETTHLGTTTAKTFAADDLYDIGTVDVELYFDASSAVPIAGAAATVAVNFSGSSTWSATACFTSFSATASMGELMTASASLKATGAITVS